MSFFKYILITTIIIVLLIATHYFGWLRPVESITVKSIGWAQGGVYNWSQNIRSVYNSWIAKRDLLVENKILTKKLKLYQVGQAKINSLEEENELLKKELKFVNEKEHDFVPAKIITGVFDQMSRSVVINQGSNAGIEKGLAVVAEGGVLIGKIIDVWPDYSKVLLLTDNKSRLAATVQNADKTAGLVEGQFGLSFSMTNIPKDQEIKEGDLIITSGLEGLIPRGLLIAEIESVNETESEIFKTAVLRPIISFDNLSYVLIIRN